MLCDLCQKRNATVHLTDEVPGKKMVQRHLCEFCCPAETLSDPDKAEEFLKRFTDESEKPKQ